MKKIEMKVNQREKEGNNGNWTSQCASTTRLGGSKRNEVEEELKRQKKKRTSALPFYFPGNNRLYPQEQQYKKSQKLRLSVCAWCLREREHWTEKTRVPTLHFLYHGDNRRYWQERQYQESQKLRLRVCARDVCAYVFVEARVGKPRK